MRRLAIVACTLAFVACDTGETETDAEPTLELDAPMQIEQTGDGLLSVETMNGDQQYLTASNGMALYLLEGRDDPAACVDACAAAWPPYTADEPVNPGALGDGPVRADLVGTVTRPDGTTQLTYAGHPLYLYAQDTGAGQATGQDVTDEWGEWYLVQPSGEMVHGTQPAGAHDDAGATMDDPGSKSR